MSAPLSAGLWGVLATPFTQDAALVDEESLRREVALHRSVPSTGLTVLGVFGEAAALDDDERRRVVEVVAEERGDLPLVVGLPGRTTRKAAAQGSAALDAAAGEVAGLMVQVNTPRSAALAAHLRAVHEATGAGIVVQDYPVVSGIRISPSDLLAAVDACPFVVAVKSESPPTAAVVAELAAGTAAPVFGGLGGVALLDELAAGSAGAMTGFSYPEGLLAALRGWREGGFSAARKAFAPWLPIAVFEAQPGVGLALRKEALRRRGVFASGSVRAPAPPLPERLVPLLAAHVEAVEALLATRTG